MIPEGTAIPTPVATENADLYTKVGVYEGAGYTFIFFICNYLSNE